MTDETINLLITIRATGVAKVCVKKGSPHGLVNGKCFPVDEIRVCGDLAQILLDINGKLISFTQYEVKPA